MLAEAATRAWAGPPLVCTSGWPNVAVLTLLRQLSACGCRLHLHADWDRAGLAIVHLLSERVGGDPWEMPPARPAGARIAYEEDHRAALLAAVLASAVAQALA